MKSYVIWLDSRESKIFAMIPGGPEVKHLHTHGHKHHTDPHGKHTSTAHPEAEPLFKDLAAQIQDAKEILLCGPSQAKTHFKTYLDQHFGHTLAKKVIGVENMDHPSENQILEFARKFFRSYDAFQG